MLHYKKNNCFILKQIAHMYTNKTHLNINNNKHLKIPLFNLINNLHRRISDRLHFSALGMFPNFKLLPITLTPNPQLLALRQKLSNRHFTANQKRFTTEQKQQFVEEMKEETFQVVSGGFNFCCLFYFDCV